MLTDHLDHVIAKAIFEVISLCAMPNINHLGNTLVPTFESILNQEVLLGSQSLVDRVGVGNYLRVKEVVRVCHGLIPVSALEYGFHVLQSLFGEASGGRSPGLKSDR